MRALAAAVLLASTAASPAMAVSEPSWFKREDVSQPHAFFGDPIIGISRDRAVLAAWSWQDGTGAGALTGERAAVQRGGDPFAPERALPAGRVGGPLLFGAAGAAVAVLRPIGSNRHPRSELRVAFGNSDGAFGATRRVVRRPRIARPALAGNARGALALAWFEDRGARSDRVAVSLRRPGGRFGAPVALATGRLRNVAVAVGDAGDVLVAWEAGGSVRARVRRAGARRFGPVERVGSEPAFGTDLHAAVARSGRAFLAWSAQRRTEGGESGPAFVEGATRVPGGRFGRAELLERLDFERPRPRVDLDVDAEGRAFVGWTGGPTGADRPRLAESGPSGRFRKLDVASVGGVSGVLADVAVGRDGGRLALWTTTELGFGEAVMASVDDGTGGGFGPAELVAGYGDVRTPRGAVAGFAAVAFVEGGRVRVAWRRPWCASVPLARCSY